MKVYSITCFTNLSTIFFFFCFCLSFAELFNKFIRQIFCFMLLSLIGRNSVNQKNLFLSKTFCFLNGEGKFFHQLLVVAVRWKINSVEASMTPW